LIASFRWIDHLISKGCANPIEPVEKGEGALRIFEKGEG
jgi:hypothetical protein